MSPKAFLRLLPRMAEKLQKSKDTLGANMDSLSELYGQGMLDGFSAEFLNWTPLAIILNVAVSKWKREPSFWVLKGMPDDSGKPRLEGKMSSLVAEARKLSLPKFYCRWPSSMSNESSFAPFFWGLETHSWWNLVLSLELSPKDKNINYMG